MGKKDTVDKPYFSDFQRFAELINTTLYHGQGILLPEKLVLLRRRYPSLASSYGELERDVLIKDTRQNICYGIEIETESDYSMPGRVITYDACEYEYQIKEIDGGHRNRKEYQSYRERKSRMKEEDLLSPIITIVLFLGEGHWQGRQKLSQMFQISISAKNLAGRNLQDYHFPLVEADYVDFSRYKTDLKEFFRAMQCRGDKTELQKIFQTHAFQHLSPETELVIARHLHIKHLVHKMEEEKLPMCKAYDELRKEILLEGIRKGKKAGKSSEKIRIIKRMISEGLDETLIHRTTKCSQEEYALAAKRSAKL